MSKASPAQGFTYQVKFFPKGSVIFKEGSPAREAFLIKSGKVRITKSYENKRFDLAIMDQGQIFGEIGVLSDKHIRTAQAQAEEPCDLIIIDKPVFRKMLTSMNQVTGTLIKSLATRLAKTTDDLHSSTDSQTLKSYYSVLQLLDDASGGNIPVKLAYEKFQNILGLEKLVVKKILTKLSLINLVDLLPGVENPETIKLIKVENIASRLKMLSDELGNNYFSERLSMKEFADLDEAASINDLEPEKLRLAIKDDLIPTEAIFINLPTLEKLIHSIKKELAKPRFKKVDDFDDINDLIFLPKERLTAILRDFPVQKWGVLLARADEKLMERIKSSLSTKMFSRIQTQILNLTNFDESDYQAYLSEMLSELQS